MRNVGAEAVFNTIKWRFLSVAYFSGHLISCASIICFQYQQFSYMSTLPSSSLY